MANTTTASAPAEAAITADSTPAPAEALASYRVLPKGAGLIYTGEFDPLTGAALTFDKGCVVEGVALAIAAELEDRGLAEVLVQA